MRAWLLLAALTIQLLSACGSQPAAKSQAQGQNPRAEELEPAPQASPAVERPPLTDECVIKPVMSDEDYHKCGAIPPRPTLRR